jgi:hypothetical protein
MRLIPEGARGKAAYTRISVSGSGNCYLIRNGSESPVRVWVTRGGLRCECGHPGCDHIASLQLCGFVESDFEGQMAA